MGWNDRYFRLWEADIHTDNIIVIFHRLYRDVKDEMSDDPRPVWVAADDFDIRIRKIRTEDRTYKVSGTDATVTRRKSKTTRKEVASTEDIQLARLIWKTAKRTDSYEAVRNLMKANGLKIREDLL